MKTKTRWQFGLLAVAAVVVIFAVTFAFLRPPVFPSDDLIRKDLGIPNSIEMHVFDRETVARGGGVVYWATIHVAEKPHRLARVRCSAARSLAKREKWETHWIHESYVDGSTSFRICERLYGEAPTEKEIDEFREFVKNFR